MATEADIPEPESITKNVGENIYLSRGQSGGFVNEISPGELNKFQGLLNLPTETSESTIAPETMKTVIEGNVELAEGERFFESPSAVKVASKETCEVTKHCQDEEVPHQGDKKISDDEKQMNNKKLEIADETGNGGNEVVEESAEKAEKNDMNHDIVNLNGTSLQMENIEESNLVGVEVLEERSVDQHAKAIMDQEKETSDMCNNEKDGTKTDRDTDLESNKQVLSKLESTLHQNEEALIHISDPKVLSLNKDVETFIEKGSGETRSKEAEHKAEKPTNLVDEEKNPEATEPSERIGNDSTVETFIPKIAVHPDIQSDEATSTIREGDGEILYKSSITLAIDTSSIHEAGPDGGEKLRELSSISCNNECQENIEPSENKKAMTQVEDEMNQKNSLDTSATMTEETCLHKVDNTDLLKITHKIWSEDIVKESPQELKELKEHIEVIEKTAEADSISNENPDQVGDGPFMKHEGTLIVNEVVAAKDASSGENRYDEGSTVIVTKDNTDDTEIINTLEHSQSGMSNCDERSENLKQNEPGKELPERSLSVVDEDCLVAASTECAEAHKEAPVKINDERLEEKITDAMEHSQSGTSDREERPENLQQNEPEKENLKGSFFLVDVDFGTVASTESTETTTRVQGETTFKSQEEGFEETMKEDIPIHSDAESKIEIPDDESVPQIELNEKIGVEVEVPIKNAKDFHDTHPSTEVAKQIEGKGLDNISNFEPEGQGQEAYEVSTEEEKHTEDAPEAYQSRNCTILEHSTTEGRLTTELITKTGQTDINILQDVSELESEEKSVIKDSGENTDQEMQINEEACGTVMHEILSRSDEAGKIMSDAETSLEVNSAVFMSDEMLQQKVQVKSPLEAAPALREDENYEAEDNNKRSNFTNEEVQDGTKITGSEVAIDEQVITSVVTNISPELIEQETVEIIPGSENEVKESEENNIEQITGESNNRGLIPESVEQVPVQNLENEKKKAEESTGEIYEKSKTGVAESVEHEASKTIESPKEILDTFQVKQGESLQSEVKNQTAVESSSEGKLQENEPREKLEQPLYLTSDKNETFSSDADNQMEEGFPQSLEEAPPEKETEKETEESNDTKDNKIAMEEDLQVVAETSEASKSTEMIALDIKSEMDTMTIEDEIKREDSKELYEDCKDAGKDRETEKHDTTEEWVTTNTLQEAEKIVQSSAEDLKEEETPEIKACAQLERTSAGEEAEIQTLKEEGIVDQSSELEVEKIEQSSKADHSVTYISSELIEQEMVEIYPTNANKAEKSEGENNIKQIVEESKITGLIPESVQQVPVKNLENEEKNAEESIAEIFEYSKTDESAESIGNETSKTTESLREILDTFPVKQGESLKTEGKSLTTTESSPDEKPQENEPGEKLEQPLSLMSNKNEAFSSDAYKMPCQIEEGQTTNLDEPLQKEESVRETEDNNDTKNNKIGMEEDLQVINGESDASKRAESMVQEPKPDMDDKVVEDEIKKEESKESCEDCRDAGKDEKIEKQDIMDERITRNILPEAIVQNYEETREDEETPKIEACAQLETTIVSKDAAKQTVKEEKTVDQFSELEVEKIEQSSNEDHTMPYDSSESVEQGAVEISPGYENKADESEGKDNINQIVEESNISNLIPESVEQVPIYNIGDEEKKAKESTREIFQNSKTEEVTESIPHETSKTMETSSQSEILDTFQVKQEESLQGEGNNLTATESSPEQKDEPEEKLEQSLSLMSDKDGTFSSDNNNIPCLMEEGASQNLEAAPQKEENESETDTKDNKMAMEEDLKVVAETSATSKSTESIVLVPMAEMDNMMLDDEVNNGGLKELCEECKDAGEVEGTKKQDSMEECVTKTIITEPTGENLVPSSNEDEREEETSKIEEVNNEGLKELCEDCKDAGEVEGTKKKDSMEECVTTNIITEPIGEDIVPSSNEDERGEETSKIEACVQSETTSVDEDASKQSIKEENIVDQSKELEVDKTEKSFDEDHKVGYIPPEPVEQETVKISPVNENNSVKSEEENNVEQILEERNITGLILESVEQVPVENLEDEEKKVEDSIGEIFDNSKMEEAGESIPNETDISKTVEMPREVCDTLQKEQGESLQSEGKTLTTTEYSPQEKGQKMEPEEKLERSLSLLSNKDETFSSDGDNIHSLIEGGASQNLEDSPQKEENVHEIEDDNDTKDNKIATEEYLQVGPEASNNTSNSTESIVLEPKSKLENIPTEDDIKNEDSTELYEIFVDVAKVEKTKKHDITEEFVGTNILQEPVGEEMVQTSKEDKKEETTKIEVCAQLETISVHDQSRELEVEKIEQSFKEDHTVAYTSPESIEQKAVDISPENENKSEGKNNIEQIFDNSKKEEMTERIADETSKTMASPREIFDSFQEKPGEILPREEKSVTAIESWPEEKPQKNEPEEKFEQSFSLMSDKNEAFSSDATKMPCQMEEGVPQNIEEAPQKEENVKEAEDSNDTRLAMDEDLQVVAETSDASKSTENTFLEPKTEIDKMVVEDYIKKEEPKEDAGKDEEIEKHSITEECVTKNILPELNRENILQSPEDDKKEEETSKTEACAQLETTSVLDQSRDLEVEKIEQSFQEDHTVAYTSPESIEQKAVDISPENENKSEGKNNIDQIFDNSKKEEMTERIADETSKTMESSREFFESFQEKHGEILPREEKNVTATESWPKEKPQKNEPEEKFEQSLSSMSDKNEAFSSDATKMPCQMEEGVPQNLEEAQQKEENVKEAEDSNDTRLAMEEDLQVVAETSEASKSTENTVLEPKTEIDNMVVEDDIKKEEPKEDAGKDEETEKHSITEECATTNILPELNREKILRSPEDDKKEEETSKTEACAQLETTSVLDQSRELEVEKIEQSFKEDHTVAYTLPESIEQKAVDISPENENKSEGKNNIDQIFDNSKKEEMTERIADETSKTMASPREIFDSFQEKPGEILPREEKSVTATESWPEEKPQKNEPEEKFEQSFSLMSDKNEAFSSDATKMPCQMEEGVPQNIEEAPQKEENVKVAEDSNDTRLAMEEDLQVVAETSDASKSTENTFLEPKTEIDKMVVEDYIKKEEPKEDAGKDEETEIHSITEECATTNILPELNREKILQSPEGDKKEEETTKTEECAQLETTSVLDQSRDLEVEKIEQSFKEDHTVAYTSPESIEQKAVDIPPENENKSEGKNNIDQIFDYSKKEEMKERIADETSKTTESPREIFYTFQEKHGEILPREEKSVTVTDPLPQEKPQKNETKEKFEQSLSLMSDKNEAFSSDATKMPCQVEEGVPQNLEEAPHNEENVKEAEDNNDTRIAMEEDLQVVAETSEASKSTENTVLEPKTEIDNMVVEDDIKKEEPKEDAGKDEETEKHSITEECATTNILPELYREKILRSPEDDKKEEETSKTEACAQLETTSVLDQSRELEVEKIEQSFKEDHTVAYTSPESIEPKAVDISPENENKSEGKNNIEQIFDNSKKEEMTEMIADETSKTMESSREIFESFQEKHGEILPREEKSVTATESWPKEKPQKNEPEKKSEQSLSLMSDKNEAFSSDAAKMPCQMEEGVPQNLEVAPQKNENVKEAEDNNDTRLAMEEDLQVVAETSEASKSTENTVLEPKTEIDNMVVEDDIKKEEPKEDAGKDEETEKHSITEECATTNILPELNRENILQSPEDDKKEEETSKTEARAQPETTSVLDQSRELEVEKIEQCFKEDHRVASTSPESIEQKAVDISPENENMSEGKNIEQIFDNSKKEEMKERIADETSKTTESPREIFYTFQEKHGEILPREEKSVTVTESLPEGKPQKNETKEKFEQSLSLMSDKNEAFSSDAVKMPCQVEEGVPQNLEEAPQKDENVKEAEDNNDTRLSMEEDLQVVAETSDASKSTENTFLEPKTEIDNMVVEDDIKKEEPKEDAGKDEETENHSITEECATTNILPELDREKIFQSPEDDKKEEETSKNEACAQLEANRVGEGAEKQTLKEENTVDQSRELEAEKIEQTSKDNDMEAMMSKQEGIEIAQTVDKDVDGEKQNIEGGAAEDNFKAFETVTSREQQRIEDTKRGLLSSTVEEETGKESSQEEDREDVKLKQEVNQLNSACIEKLEVTNSAEETVYETLKDGVESNVNSSPLDIKEASEEETPTKEINGCQVEKSTLTEEICLPDAELQDKEEVESFCPAFEEKSTVGTKTKETLLENVDINAKPEDTSNLGEMRDKEIPTASDQARGKTDYKMENEVPHAGSKDQKEVTTKEMPLEEILEVECSAMTSKEHEPMTSERSDTVSETTAESQASYENTETPRVAQAIDMMLMQIQDETKNPSHVSEFGPVDAIKETANDEVQKQKAEDLFEHPQLDREKSLNISEDVETSEREETRELAYHSDTCTLKTLEDVESSRMEKAEDENPCYEVLRSAETSVICTESEKSILEQEKICRSNSMKSFEVEKAAIEQKGEVHSQRHEDIDTNNTGTLSKEIFKASDPDQKLEHASEAVAEEQRNQILPESDKNQIEEDCSDNQNKEDEKEIREKEEPELEAEDQKEQNANENIKAVILNEKAHDGDKQSDDSEDIKELVVEKRGINELHALSTVGKTTDEVQESSSGYSEYSKAADSKEKTETENSAAEEDTTWEREAPSARLSEEQKVQDSSIEPPAKESKEKIEEEIAEKSQDCNNKIDNATLTTVTETSPVEAELGDKLVKAFHPDQGEPCLETTEIQYNQQVKEVESMNIEETSCDMASRLQTKDSGHVESMTITVENTARGEPERNKSASEAVDESKGQGTVEKDFGKCLTVENLDQVPTNDHDHAEKNNVAMEHSYTDEVEETKIASKAVDGTECQDAEGTAETGRSPNVAKMNQVPSSTYVHAQEDSFMLENSNADEAKIMVVCESKGQGTEESVEKREGVEKLNQVPATNSDDEEKVSVAAVAEEKKDEDEVVETKLASNLVYQSKEQGTEDSDEMGKSPTTEKPDADKSEEACKETSDYRAQGVEPVTKDEITAGQTPSVEKLEERLLTLNSALPFKHGTTTTVENIEEEKTEKMEMLGDEDPEDSSASKPRKEINLPEDGPRELGVSTLGHIITKDIKGSPTEVHKEEGKTHDGAIKLEHPENENNIRCIDSSSECTKMLEPTRPTEKVANLKCETSEMALESELVIHRHEVLPELEDTEIKEKHLLAAVTDMRMEENQSKKSSEANEITPNEDLQEIIEEKEVAETYQTNSLCEEKMNESVQEDELKHQECTGEKTTRKSEAMVSEIQDEELSMKTEKAAASKTIGKQIAAEDKSVEQLDQVSVENKMIKGSSPNESEGNDVDDPAIKLNSRNQGEENNFGSAKTEATVIIDEEPSIEISQKESIGVFEKGNKLIQETQKSEKTSCATSEKQIPREANVIDCPEVMASTGNEHVPPVLQEGIAGTSQNVEAEVFRPGNSKGVHSEAKEVKHGGENRMDGTGKEINDESTLVDSDKALLSDLFQRSTKETMQVGKEVTEEREPTGSTEERQTEEAETIRVKDVKTYEEKDEDEGDEHKKTDSSSDAPVIVEASRDMDVKVAHKKSHGILSGVGSKVKHSISKVKKAITGKSSHHSKPVSPK